MLTYLCCRETLYDKVKRVASQPSLAGPPMPSAAASSEGAFTRGPSSTGSMSSADEGCARRPCQLVWRHWQHACCASLPGSLSLGAVQAGVPPASGLCGQPEERQAAQGMREPRRELTGWRGTAGYRLLSLPWFATVLPYHGRLDAQAAPAEPPMQSRLLPASAQLGLQQNSLPGLHRPARCSCHASCSGCPPARSPPAADPPLRASPACLPSRPAWPLQAAVMSWCHTCGCDGLRCRASAAGRLTAAVTSQGTAARLRRSSAAGT